MQNTGFAQHSRRQTAEDTNAGKVANRVRAEERLAL